MPLPPSKFGRQIALDLQLTSQGQFSEEHLFLFIFFFLSVASLRRHTTPLGTTE